MRFMLLGNQNLLVEVQELPAIDASAKFTLLRTLRLLLHGAGEPSRH